MVMLIIGTATSFGWLMALLQVPAQTVALMRGITEDPLLTLLLINVILLLLGTFMDMAPLIMIGTPIFLPVAKSLGMDPVHFGVMLILNLGIGTVTPPVGPVLFVACAVGKVSMWEATKSSPPFYAACLLVLLLVTYVPALSLWLPSLFR
jgi:tripartite ATP-independent transporter DctM subunit